MTTHTEKYQEAVERNIAAATAAKYNKPPVYQGVLARFPRALLEVAKVSEYGCRKHEVAAGDMSYLDIPDAQAVFDNALARHQNSLAQGHVINPKDGGLLHRAQLLWNALAGLETFLRDREWAKAWGEVQVADDVLTAIEEQNAVEAAADDLRMHAKLGAASPEEGAWENEEKALASKGRLGGKVSPEHS